MSKQNIYDDEDFFHKYKKMRENSINANVTIEKPLLFSLLPDLKNKKILDLGCGFGENCIKFIKLGAEKVVAIDISEKMLEIAKEENKNINVSYINMPIENIDEITEKFDIIVSSLVFHYVEDYLKLVKDVYGLLENNGCFVFTQEHPLCTCHSDGMRWTRDEDGNRIYANIYNYTKSGKRESKWFVDNVIKYHRTFSDLVNGLIEARFKIDKIVEPSRSDNLHRPDFIAFRLYKDR